MSPSGKSSFSKKGVRDYERRRYRGLDQRFVHAREMKILRKALQAAAPLPVPRLLDLPCGYGRFTGFLQDLGGFLVGSDLSEHMVRRAAEKGTSGTSAAVVADAKQGLPFKPGAFGLVFSMRFFHHLHDGIEREAVLSEFSRVSSRWVVLSYYQVTRLHLLQRELRKRFKKSRIRIKMISREELEVSAGRAGLRLVCVYPLLRGVHSQHVVLLEKN